MVPLPGTEWTVWRDALLRSAGFPAAGLDRFSAPDCAAVADAFLDRRAGQDEAEEAHACALAQARTVAEDIAADPLFREALVWQNPGVAARIASEPQSRQRPSRRGYRMKARENTIARYWQRYCGKNDTIGFFGPVTWAILDPQAPGVRVRCGDGLLRARTTYYEHWALQAYASRLDVDPAVRPWLPVGLQPHVTVDGHRVLIPGQAPVALSPAESALLARCDGHRPAADVAGGTGQAAALALLDGLADRGVVWWGVNLPPNPGAEETLRATLTAISDLAARERALSGLRRLDAARAGVNAARGDADKLVAAMSQLDAEFTSVTGASPERRQGQMYAGRKLCYEDTLRDVDVTFGGPVLDALAGPFGTVFLPAARWLSVALAGGYTEAFRTVFAELGGSREAGVPLDRFWTAALPLITSVEPVARTVAADLTSADQAVRARPPGAGDPPGDAVEHRPGRAGGRTVRRAAAGLGRGPDSQPGPADLRQQRGGHRPRRLHDRARRTARDVADPGLRGVHRPAPRRRQLARGGGRRYRPADPSAVRELVPSVHPAAGDRLVR